MKTPAHLAATPAGRYLLSLDGEATQGEDVLRSRLRAVEEARRGGRQTREGQSAQVADGRLQGKYGSRDGHEHDQISVFFVLCT